MSGKIFPTTISDKCIVLDLDQTLIATQDDHTFPVFIEIMSNPNLVALRNRTYHLKIDDLGIPGIGSTYECWGVLRPHLFEFITFCFSYFKIVAVWSAGKRSYVEAVVDYIFRDFPRPHIVFTHDDVTFSSKNHLLKSLLKMINHNDVTKKFMKLTNTLVLDDNPTTFALNRNNGVLIPEYAPRTNIASLSENDNSLIKFEKWMLLPEVINSVDVNTLQKPDLKST